MSLALLDEPCILWPVFLVGAIAAGLLTWRMRKLGEGVEVTPPPRQVTLELAWTPRKALRLIRAWSETGCMRVRRQITYDFALIVAYVLAGSAATLLVGGADRTGHELAALRLPVVGCWIAAGLFDVAENLALLRILPPPKPRPGCQPVASLFATIKFALLILSCIYLLVALKSPQLGLATPSMSPSCVGQSQSCPHTSKTPFGSRMAKSRIR